MALAQSVVVSGTAGLTVTNDPTADYTITEGGLAFPDFEIRNTYGPDSDDFPGAVLTAYAMGVGTLPLTIDVKGATVAELQTNRRALEAAFAQVGETVTLSIGGEEEVYPMFPSWPKWGAIGSARIITATLSVPVNPMVVA